MTIAPYSELPFAGFLLGSIEPPLDGLRVMKAMLDASQAGANQLLVQHPLAHEDISQKAVVAIDALAVELQPHLAAGDELPGKGGRFRPPGFDWMIGSHGLGTIDADQSHPGAAGQQQCIAIDDPLDAMRPFGERLRIGRLSRKLPASCQQQQQYGGQQSKSAAPRGMEAPSQAARLLKQNSEPAEKRRLQNRGD